MTTQIKLLVITSILITANSCRVNKQQVEKDFIQPEQIAFIEFIHTQDGEVISGTAPQGRRIDGPTYRFDKETRQLEILRKEDFELDTVKAFFGYVRILKGAAGSGLSMRLNAISKFPYFSNNLTIIEVRSDGIKVTFNRKELFLKEGEVWESSISKIDTIKMETNIVIATTTTYSINYHGLIDKKGVIQ